MGSTYPPVPDSTSYSHMLCHWFHSLFHLSPGSLLHYSQRVVAEKFVLSPMAAPSRLLNRQEKMYTPACCPHLVAWATNKRTDDGALRLCTKIGEISEIKTVESIAHQLSIAYVAVFVALDTSAGAFALWQPMILHSFASSSPSSSTLRPSYPANRL